MQNPQRVEMIRSRLELTKIEFAKALGVDRRTIQRFEAGECDLNEHSMNALVERSGYPKEFFEKGSVDFPNPEAVSFRSLRSLTAKARNAALAAGALAFELDDWISDLFELPEHRLPLLDTYEPVEAAVALRAHWGIGVRPITNMMNLLESRGVRVFSLTEETRHLDAYSFWRNETPYVFLNTIKTPEHSLFDAAHELGHLVLHRHGGPGHRSAEDEANSFAASFLMPPADLKAHMTVVRGLADLLDGKKRWRVSAAALAYTLHKQGAISDWHYRGYCIELNKFGREREPHGIEPETSQVWQNILTSLWRDGTTLENIADELKIPMWELSNLLFGIVSPVGIQGEESRPPVRLIK